jgi:hypothetical protein
VRRGQDTRSPSLNDTTCRPRGNHNTPITADTLRIAGPRKKIV